MLLSFDNLAKFQKLTHAVTTRFLDSSDEIFNLSATVGENKESALENRKKLCQHLSLDYSKLTLAQQIHQANVAIIDDSSSLKEIPATDAMITNLSDTPLMVFSADCPSIILYDPQENLLALIHSSWRSMFRGIISKTIDLLSEKFHSQRKNIIAGIGPGAGVCCYQIDQNFIDIISERAELLKFVTKNDKLGLTYDLPSAINDCLLRGGIPSGNIERMNICTICDENFFSFRREGNNAGRFVTIAAISNG